MNCHVEWIRNFLLRKSTVPSNYISQIRNNTMKSSAYADLSALRYQLLKPGFSPFINHTFYSITISIIDANFSYENSNFSIIRSYLLQYLPSVNVSIDELESKQFSPSHYTLCKSILTYYIRFYLKPSTISPTCYGSDIQAYEKSLYEWGRSICKGEIPYLPGNFMIDFGTAQVVSIILSKIHPELIQLNRITFSERMDQSAVIRNWREVGTALNVIGVHVPTEKEWGDNLCLLCFGVDLFNAIYDKPKSSNLVEFQMKQNQINQQINYQMNNNSDYCANNEINKIDFLIGQLNSISNGNPNVFLSEPFQQNPILVQQQRILQYQQQQQQLLQIEQQQLLQYQQNQINQQLNQPQMLNYQHNNYDNTIENSRVKIISSRRQKKDLDHIESKKIELPEKRRNNEDDLIYQRAEKYKLLKELKKSEKQKVNKSPKKLKETEKPETIQNFKIMSSFAIDPSFPGQCKLTTYKEVNHPNNSQKLNQINGNQFKQLQKFDNFEQKDKKKKKKENENITFNNNNNNSSVKCSYVTFDDNKEDQINSQNQKYKNNSKKSKNNQHQQHHHNHHNSVIKRNSLFDDVIEADKPDFQNPKSSQDFQNLISKQKDEFKKKNKLNSNKNGTDLLESINSFIEQQREAIAAASLAKKVGKSKIQISEQVPDFSQFDATQPESINIFNTDPLLLINSKSNEDNRNSNKKNAKNLPITSHKNTSKINNEHDKSHSSPPSSSLPSPRSKSKNKTSEMKSTHNESENRSSFNDPLIEFAKNSQNIKTENKYDIANKERFHSNSSSSKRNKKNESVKPNHLENKDTNSSSEAIKLNSSSASKRNKKTEPDKSNRLDNSDSNSSSSSSVKVNSSSSSKQNKKAEPEKSNHLENYDSNPSSSSSKRNKKIEQENPSHLDNSDSFSSSSMKSKVESSNQTKINQNNNIKNKTNESESSDNIDNNNESLSINKNELSGKDDADELNQNINSINQNQEIESKSNSSNQISDENSDKEQNSGNKTNDFAEPNKNISEHFSHIKNSSKMDDFSMKSELTFPDIPSLIDPSFRFDQQQSEVKVPDKDQSSSNIQNLNRLLNSGKANDLNKISGIERISSKANDPSAEHNSSKMNDSTRLQDSEHNSSRTQNSTKPQNPNKVSNIKQISGKMNDSTKLQNSEHNSSKIHNLEQNLDQESFEPQDSNKDLLSDIEKKSSTSKKRPIPHPPPSSPNSTNFASSNSKLPFLSKSNGLKSDSLTPAELSIVSGFEGDLSNANNKTHESDSASKHSNKSLHDDNELSIDQNSSEMKANASNSNANSDSFAQSPIKKASNHSSDSKLANSAQENSQSSNRVESAVEEFIPEIEKISSGMNSSSTGKKRKQKQNERENGLIEKIPSSSQNNQNDDDDDKNKTSIKKFHSSSSSSDSIPFKVLHSDSEKNSKKSEVKNDDDETSENFDKKEDSKPFTSVIEEFDLSSIKPSKRNKVPIQSISGPIILNEDPIPKGNQNKGPSSATSETRRVSFSLGAKGFAPPQSFQTSTNRNNSSTTNSSLNFNLNDVDTFMSTASLSHSLSIPIEERLKMYSKDHNELSLSLSEAEPEVIREYRDVSTTNVGKKYIWLSNDEQALLENVLPSVVQSSEIQDLPAFISKELKIPKNNSSVHRIAANIKTFLLSRGRKL